MSWYVPCVAGEQYEKGGSEASSIHHSGKCGGTDGAKLLEALFNMGTSEEKKIIISNSI